VSRVVALLACFAMSGCFESIDHELDSGSTDSGFDGGTDAGTDQCHESAECPCAQECQGAPLHCVPVTPSTCDATTHCDTIIAGSTCTAALRFGSLCGYHACLLPDGGP
jgi:hypothetical protein